jgi:ADP-ribosylglycohydrolase
MITPTRRDCIEGGLVGLLVGDALGVPYEFYPAGEIPPIEEVEFEPPSGFRKAHWGVPAGTYSDDGAQALCLLASLQHCGGLDPDDLGRRLLDWYLKGYMAVDSKVFDIGNQTVRALAALKDGEPAEAAGPRGERDNGNGSLMRVLPLALWHQGADARLVADACLQSRVTHGHPRSQVCCALYCLWARRTLGGAEDPWTEAVATLRGLLDPESPLAIELEKEVRPDDPGPGSGGGYVVDCLRSAGWAVGQGSYEAVVKAAVRLGDDTDTTAAVAGGIAGLRDGIGAIPPRWREALRGRDLFGPLLERLLTEAS